jgi:type II secretory pathway pseudopilin PulG
MQSSCNATISRGTLSRRQRRDGESGFVLLAVICLTVLLLIALAIAAPKMAQSIQRDKDLEAIHRGEQYREAIALYYKKFGAYPTSVDQLLSTDNMRFLRRRYTDPLTGKDDWKPVYYGHAHVHPLGFFGKPLSVLGGIAASGGMYAITPVSTDANGNSTDSGGNSVAGTTAGNASGSSMFGTNSSSMGDGMFSSGQSGIGGGFGSPTSPTGAASPTSSGFGSSSGTSATTFGANGTGPIVGFTLPVNKPSLVDYMEQTRYNKWEFNYDPAADQMEQAVSLLGGGANLNNSSSATTANPFGGFDSNSTGSTNGATGTTNGNPGTNTGTSSPGSTTNPQSPNLFPNNPQQ